MGYHFMHQPTNHIEYAQFKKENPEPLTLPIDLFLEESVNFCEMTGDEFIHLLLSLGHGSQIIQDILLEAQKIGWFSTKS